MKSFAPSQTPLSNLDASIRLAEALEITHYIIHLGKPFFGNIDSVHTDNADIMNKVWDKVRSAVMDKATKFLNVKVNRGRTAFPSTSKEKQNLGIRFDFDGEETAEDGSVYNLFQVQPNAGDVPSAFKKMARQEWRITRSYGGSQGEEGRYGRRREGGCGQLYREV